MLSQCFLCRMGERTLPCPFGVCYLIKPLTGEYHMARKTLKVSMTLQGDNVVVKVTEQSHRAGEFGNMDSGHGKGLNKFKANNYVVLATWGYPDFVPMSKCNNGGPAFFFRGTKQDRDENTFTIPLSMVAPLNAAIAEYNAFDFSELPGAAVLPVVGGSVVNVDAPVTINVRSCATPATGEDDEEEVDDTDWHDLYMTLRHEVQGVSENNSILSDVLYGACPTAWYEL